MILVSSDEYHNFELDDIFNLFLDGFHKGNGGYDINNWHNPLIKADYNYLRR